MGLAAGIGAGLQGLGLLGNLMGNAATQKAEEAAIRLKMQQERAAEQVRSVKRSQSINEILASQTASLGARGLSGVGSPSAFAVSMDSINKYAFDENADMMNLDYESINSENKIANSRAKETFGDLNSFISVGNTLYEGMYTGSSTKTGKK